MRFIEYMIRKIKGDDFSLDSNIKLSYLINLIFNMIINLIRGNFKSLFIKKRSPIIFIGSGTKLKAKNNIRLGRGANIGSDVVIDALSKNGVVLGDNVKIGDYTKILCTGTIRSIGEGVEIGNNCGIAENCFFGAAGGIKIGNDVIMGQNVRFHSENHNYNDLDQLIRLQGVTRQGIKIGNNCWIGAGVVFLDGAELGDGCIVGANSVVNRKFGDNNIIVGMPAKTIKKRGEI